MFQYQYQQPQQPQQPQPQPQQPQHQQQVYQIQPQYVQQQPYQQPYQQQPQQHQPFQQQPPQQQIPYHYQQPIQQPQQPIQHHHHHQQQQQQQQHYQPPPPQQQQNYQHQHLSVPQSAPPPVLTPPKAPVTQGHTPPSDILVSFTKELALILFQNYIDSKSQPRTGYIRFSRNFYGEASDQAHTLRHIATDLGLEQPIQHLGCLFLKIVPKSSLTSLPQIEAFVSTALRIQTTPSRGSSNAIGTVGAGHVPADISANKLPTNSPLHGTPWAAIVANGTLCMRQFFENVAIARQQQLQQQRGVGRPPIDSSIDTILQERHELLCGHLLPSVSELSSFGGVQCRFCNGRFWWSWCVMRVVAVCQPFHHSAMHSSSQVMQLQRSENEMIVEDVDNAVWHSPQTHTCVLATSHWECTCGATVEGLSYPCPSCVTQRGVVVYFGQPNSLSSSATTASSSATSGTIRTHAPLSVTDDVLDAFGVDSMGRRIA